MMPIIDKKAFQPAYSQLVDILKEQIASGKYPPGSWLPSESQLRNLYDVSAVTIRRAISILVEEGVVETTKGKGTLVKPLGLDAAYFDLGKIRTIFQDHASTQIKLVFTRIMPADAETAGKLKIREGDRVIHIRRMIERHGRPLIYHQENLICDPRRPVVESELSLTSLEGLFENSGTGAVKKGILNLKVTALGEYEAKHLGKDTGCPAFHLEHLFFDLKDNAISWGWFRFCDDALGFTTYVGMWP